MDTDHSSSIETFALSTLPFLPVCACAFFLPSFLPSFLTVWLPPTTLSAIYHFFIIVHSCLTSPNFILFHYRTFYVLSHFTHLTLYLSLPYIISTDTLLHLRHYDSILTGKSTESHQVSEPNLLAATVESSARKTNAAATLLLRKPYLSLIFTKKRPKRKTCKCFLNPLGN
jgi:hypothetical protein